MEPRQARGAGGLTASSRAARPRRNRPEARQQRLKPAARAARARVVAPELLEQLDRAAADCAQAALDPGLARVALTPLAGPLESTAACRGRGTWSWEPPVESSPAGRGRPGRGASVEHRALRLGDHLPAVAVEDLARVAGP